MLTKNPQRIAWLTVLGGLSLFCLICIGTFLFARWVVYESPTDMNVMVYVGQGTVGLLEPDAANDQAIRISAGVDPDDRLSTDNLSQGYLAFSDPLTDEIVATVTLRGNSTAKLKRASRPRFNISANPYTIRLADVTGSLEVWVSDDLERDIILIIESPAGKITITQKGNYLITATPELLAVHARDGTAEITGPNGVTRTVAPTMLGTLKRATNTITVSQGPVDLIPYSTFGTDWPKDWICAHEPDPGFPNAPGGNVAPGTAGGRPTIRLVRAESGATPAKTGCYQRLDLTVALLDEQPAAADGNLTPNTPIFDVTPLFDDLRLRVTMQVNNQSLDICGTQGTECAVMLHIEYEDQNKISREWYHGFYIQARPGVQYPITCDQCLQPHELINQSVWFTFESGDLLNEWPKDIRPSRITLIEFYASGHDYDVLLREVALIATQLDDATP